MKKVQNDTVPIIAMLAASSVLTPEPDLNTKYFRLFLAVRFFYSTIPWTWDGSDTGVEPNYNSYYEIQNWLNTPDSFIKLYFQTILMFVLVLKKKYINQVERAVTMSTGS